MSNLHGTDFTEEDVKMFTSTPEMEHRKRHATLVVAEMFRWMLRRAEEELKNMEAQCSSIDGNDEWHLHRSMQHNCSAMEQHVRYLSMMKDEADRLKKLRAATPSKPSSV